MESKWVKVLDNGHRIIVDAKRKRAAQCATNIIEASHKVLSVQPNHNSLFMKLGKRKRLLGCKTICGVHFRKSLHKNYSNFMKNGLPQWLLFYQNGDWNDFPRDIVELVSKDFQMKNAAIEVQFKGCHLMFDILYMIQVDLKTGSQRPIAWIDESGLDTVKNMFVVGMNPSLNANILEINRCSGNVMQTRWEIFQKQIEITQRYRGDPNVRYAWLASTKDALPTVKCALTSASNCDVDENGIQHMVFCHVIQGNMELVHPGSRQFHPSSENFDSGVHDLQNPSHYIVWNMNMSTHIYLEYVVSFKTSHSAEEALVGKGSRFDVPGVTICQDHHGQLQLDSSSVETGDGVLSGRRGVVVINAVRGCINGKSWAFGIIRFTYLFSKNQNIPSVDSFVASDTPLRHFLNFLAPASEAIRRHTTEMAQEEVGTARVDPLRDDDAVELAEQYRTERQVERVGEPAVRSHSFTMMAAPKQFSQAEPDH
ncbi:hypothetical protein HYC85_013219 [Camellia sinensis]|uniref:Uncharacterized protein n=1 Tax=Camellia sinensis TaxID=4442 RepID=A0A7J7H2S1_CAMSI|nr:hypothetical protein HYC85_013219 [Camellia sinensis]